MYESYFGLTERPFSIAPDPQYLYMSSRHKEAMAHLTYGLSQGGCFIVLTGEVGTGKTTLCRNLLGQLPDNVDVALILNANINELELLQTICDERKISYTQDTTQKQLLDLINNYLLKTFSENRHTVLIIDEAQLLSRDVLEQIRLLTNLETNKSKLLQIILIGQPELNDLLRRNDLRQLAQRVTARYHLGALERSEIEEYVNFRLGVAGCTQPIFSKQALNKLHSVSEGIPRKINVLADHALLAAYSRSQASVDSKTIKAASQEVFIDNAPKRQRSRRSDGRVSNIFAWLPTWWPVLVVIILLNVALWWWFSGEFKPRWANAPKSTPIAVSDQQSTESGAENITAVVDDNLTAESLDDPASVTPQLEVDQSSAGLVVEKTSSTIALASSEDFANAVKQSLSSEVTQPGKMVVSDEVLDESIDPELTIESLVSDRSTTSTASISSAAVADDSTLTGDPSATSELDLLLETSADVTGRIFAFRNLAASWGEQLPERLIQPACQVLAQSGLRCVGFNNWGQLERFNRPAILVLNHGNQLHRVIVNSIDQDNADLTIGEQRLSVPVSVLRSRWNKSGVLFWRPIPSLGELYQLGDRGPSTVQVKAALNSALSIARMPLLDSPDSVEFDLDVSQKTFALQTRFGIIGDSRIGNETQMLINELITPDTTPVLFKRVP